LILLKAERPLLAQLGADRTPELAHLPHREPGDKARSSKLRACCDSSWCCPVSLVAIARRHGNPSAIPALDVTTIAVIVIAAPAPLAFSGDGSSGACTDDRAYRRTAASADGPADDGATDSAQQRAAKRVLGRGLMNRHRQRYSQQRRTSNSSKHSALFPFFHLIRYHACFQPA
jgi:hypothetical protein